MNKKIIFLIFLIFATGYLIGQKAASPDTDTKKIEEIAKVSKQKPSEQKNENIPTKKTNQSKKINEKTKSNTIKSSTKNKSNKINDKKLTEKTNSKSSKDVEQKNIYLNFENTELSNFINYIAEIKNINLIPHKTLEGVKVSLTIREPLTVDGAWNVFLTVLEMAGFSIVKIGNVDVVVPKKDKARQPLPAYINVPLEDLPSSDINVRYVTFLENVDVNTIQDLLKSMLSPEHVLIPYPEVNGLIITDKSYNIKSAMKVIRALDQTGLQESVVVIKLKNVNATDVKGLFDSLIKKEDNASPLARLLGRQAETTLQYFSPTTRIIAEERTNSLILLGNKNSIAKIEDFIVNHIDKELKGTTSPLHIYELQHTDAEQIKTILETVTNVSDIGEQATKYGAVRGGVKYFKPMKFEVDKDGNRLIVSSTDKQDWTLLKKTIEDLDKPQPQVALECLFVTVDATDSKSLGGALRNKKEGQIGKGINFQSPSETGVVVKGTTSPDSQNLLGNMLNAVSGGLGSSIISFGPDANIWGVFKALKAQTNASIISQPFLSVANKTKGELQFGTTINIPYETTAGGFDGYKELEAITKLYLTPQINVEGIIRLTIDIDISEFTNEENGTKDMKKVTTDVTVADGQVIALGGFVKTKTTENLKKTPILGDIPVLGWLFKHKSRIITKNYIFIFISPTIIKPRKTPGTNLYTRMKLHQAKQNIDDSVKMSRTKDPIHNWFFNPENKEYSNKVVDFASAKYQPTTVDIKNDPYYRVHTERTDDIEEYQDFDNNYNQNTKNSSKIKSNRKQKIIKNKKINSNKKKISAKQKNPILANKKNKKNNELKKSKKDILKKADLSDNKKDLKQILKEVDLKKVKINNPYKNSKNKNSQRSVRNLKKLKRRRT
ncbi:hypothetical protein GF385_03020 [Candidatus Dependentiae bacterium]|nr:hypothetical protein [Candidatus Dependentiae bacterium]